MGKYLEIGRITKTHGLKGMVRVISYLTESIFINQGEKILVVQNDRESFCEVQTFRPQGTHFLIKFAGIETPEAAAELVGATLRRNRDKFPPLEENEYYWADLLGMEVMTETGESVGKLEAILPTGSNDVFICRRPEGETLVPGIGEVVLSVDVEKKAMIVRLLPEV